MLNLSQIRLLISVIVVTLGLVVFLGALHNGLTPSRIANKATSLLPGSTYSNERLAYMTFLSGTMANASDSDLEHDHYFVATRILGYQLMHQTRTKTTRNIPFVVLVTQDIPQDKRDRLAKDGAIVIPIDYLRAQSDWIVGEMPEWRDVMTKLRAWELSQFDRVAFFDGDVLLNRCIDGVFDDPATQFKPLNYPVKHPADEGYLQKDYVLASMPEANPFHKYPPLAAQGDFKDPDYFNAGFFVFAPSADMFNHYRTVMELEGRFDPRYPEQNLLNYVHRKDGRVPWQHMDTSWNIRYPSVDDVNAGVVSVHDKFWHAHMDPNLQPYYDSMHWKMRGYYEAADMESDI